MCISNDFFTLILLKILIKMSKNYKKMQIYHLQEKKINSWYLVLTIELGYCIIFLMIIIFE